MVRTILYLLSLAVALCYAFSASAQSEKRITILYDAFGPPSSLKMDWGFAALIEYNGRRILFDTGNNAKIFEHNVNQLNVDLTKLDAVVISHRHGDHTSGLNHLVKINPTVRIYAPMESAYFNSDAGRVPSAHPWPAAQHELLSRRAAGRLSLGLAMAGGELRDRPADHGNFSRLLRIDHRVPETGHARHERGVAGDQDAGGTRRRSGMFASRRRKNP